MARLFMTNIPCDWQDAELRGWIEDHGFHVDSIRLVRDLVAGASASFGYVSLRNARVAEAINVLHGQYLKGRMLQVRKDWRDEHHRG